ncbi:MAG: ECF transporter S component, partial [Lachnospiraceae bacterium]|nr:ECF transporter S component [Lachnospiraceae bacterium]
MSVFQKIGHILKKQNISALLICLCGVALNMILNAAVVAMELPLYLDTVGTVAVAALGGYLPGAIVGFSTNIIKSISDPSSLYYGVLNVMIAVCAAYLSRPGWFKRYTDILKAIIAFTLIGGGLGSIIPWYMEGLAFDSEALRGILYRTGFFNMEASHILSSLILDLPDKAVTVLLVVLLLRLIPERFYGYCRFRMWMQNPSSVTKIKSVDKTNARSVSLRTKVLLMLGTSLVVVAVVAAVISMKSFHKAAFNEHMQLAQGTAGLAAKVVDGDRVEAYLENAGNAQGYDETRAMLQDILMSSTDISFLYVYKIENDGCHVVFDTDTEDAPGEATGNVIPFDEGFSEYVPALLRGEEVEPIVTNDTYGHLLTVYKAVYDSE